MHDLMVSAIIAAEKETLMLGSTYNYVKVTGVYNIGQGHRVIVCA